jgi:hypothetical protein
MARRYVRDAKGRFAGKGFSGQTGGRGARLKSGKGNIREVGGQKRGERHILRSAETKAASKKSFDASVQSGNITLPKKLGGQGMPRGSFMAQAASRKKAQAVAERDSALRKSGLPKSGGAMRVKGGIKRDPNAGQKLAATAKPAAAKRRKAEPKDGTDITREIGRKKGNERIKNLNQQIKEAGTNAAGLRLEKLSIQTRMPNKPRQRVQPTAKQSAKEASRNDAIRKRSAELRAQSGRVNRAYANQARTADTRNKPGSSMIRRPSRKTTRGAIRAEQALSFIEIQKEL